MNNIDNIYGRQVSLLVQMLPIIDTEKCFALKGGTAINLFYRDLPRLSVDIDLLYSRWKIGKKPSKTSRQPFPVSPTASGRQSGEPQSSTPLNTRKTLSAYSSTQTLLELK